jgi:integrase
LASACSVAWRQRSERTTVLGPDRGLGAAHLDARKRADALAALDLLPSGVSLVDAARFYNHHHQGIRESKPVKDVLAELLRAKKQDGLSRRYLDDLRQRLGRFSAEFGELAIAELSSSQIDRWLRKLPGGALNRNTFGLRLNVLFAFAKRHRWCTDNPVGQIEKAKWIGSEPSILRPVEFARLLENASAETVPYWAIGGFAGLRSAELQRLEWQDIDFDRGLVEVTRGKSKTASRRHIPIRACLAAWLIPYRVYRSGKVCPLNLRTKLERDRQRAGIESWPANALRHSFASYHLEHFKLPGELCIEMGHTDPNLVQKFYRQRVKPEAAEAWWSIMPPATGASNIVEASFAVA